MTSALPCRLPGAVFGCDSWNWRFTGPCILCDNGASIMITLSFESHLDSIGWKLSGRFRRIDRFRNTWGMGDGCRSTLLCYMISKEMPPTEYLWDSPPPKKIHRFARVMLSDLIAKSPHWRTILIEQMCSYMVWQCPKGNIFERIRRKWKAWKEKMTRNQEWLQLKKREDSLTHIFVKTLLKFDICGVIVY